MFVNCLTKQFTKQSDLQEKLFAPLALGKQPRRHVLISGAFGVGKHVAAELIGRLFGLLNNQLVARVPSSKELQVGL